jgi:hypothetical protein
MAQMITLNHVKAPGRRGFDPMIDVTSTDDARTNAFARAAESCPKLTMSGAGQADFVPRNIFLLGDLQSPTLRAVVK